MTPLETRIRTSVTGSREHLESLLDEADLAIDAGRRDLAITHLAQAVLVAADYDGPVDRVGLQRRVRNLIAVGGGLA